MLDPDFCEKQCPLCTRARAGNRVARLFQAIEMVVTLGGCPSGRARQKKYGVKPSEPLPQPVTSSTTSERPIHNAAYLDCCDRPQVVTIKSLYLESHDSEALCQCQTCEAYWFWRFHEVINWSGGNDDWTVWYSWLTPAQGKLIVDAQERPDWGFLSTAPSFVKDTEGVKRVTGQPTHPGS